MKKYLSKYILASALVLIFVFSLLITPTSATVTTSPGMTLSQFVELMISLGVVPNERVAAARALIQTLSANSAISPSTSTSSLPYIQVLSPNGAENWDMDVNVAYNITWGSSMPVPVTVSLAPTKGAACDLTALPVVSKKGDNSLAVKLKTALCYNSVTGTSTILKDGVYKVRVAYNIGTTTIAKDESNAVFKINPILIPSLKVSYPNGGENLVRGKKYVAKYTLKNALADNSGLIYLNLLDNSGESVFNSHKLVTSAGTYDLELPSSLTPGAYKVKMKMTTSKGVELEDVSDNFFWVSSAL